METSAILDALKNSILEKLFPILLQRGLNMAMPELGDLLATGIENWRKELPPATQALFP